MRLETAVEVLFKHSGSINKSTLSRGVVLTQTPLRSPRIFYRLLSPPITPYLLAHPSIVVVPIQRLGLLGQAAHSNIAPSPVTTKIDRKYITPHPKYSQGKSHTTIILFIVLSPKKKKNTHTQARKQKNDIKQAHLSKEVISYRQYEFIKKHHSK